MTEARLLEFAAAWGRKDLESLMAMFTDDCVYKASVGDEPGATYIGQAAVRAGVLEMLKVDDGSMSEITRVHISGDVGFWEWTYRFPDGRAVFGCDLFEFVGNCIRVKNAFRKTK